MRNLVLHWVMKSNGQFISDLSLVNRCLLNGKYRKYITLSMFKTLQYKDRADFVAVFKSIWLLFLCKLTSLCVSDWEKWGCLRKTLLPWLPLRWSQINWTCILSLFVNTLNIAFCLLNTCNIIYALHQWSCWSECLNDFGWNLEFANIVTGNFDNWFIFESTLSIILLKLSQKSVNVQWPKTIPDNTSILDLPTVVYTCI